MASKPTIKVDILDHEFRNDLPHWLDPVERYKGRHDATRREKHAAHIAELRAKMKQDEPKKRWQRIRARSLRLLGPEAERRIAGRVARVERWGKIRAEAERRLGKRFDPSQPRDEHGRWTDAGGNEPESNPSTSPHAKDPTSASSLLRVEKVTTADLYAKVPGSQQQDAEARAKLASEGEDTEKLYKLPSGHWAPDRLPTHHRIARELMPVEQINAATPPPGEQPTLYILGGRGGSGKGWFTKKGSLAGIKDKAVYVNNDDVKERMPEWRGWNAGQVHEEASHIGEGMEKYARDNKLNLIVDATLKSEKSLAQRIKEFKAAGYKISGHYMYASPATAAERALKRFVDGNAEDGKGRFVPPEYSLASTTNEHTFDSHRDDMDYWEIYDNMGKSPKLHSRKGG